MKKLILLALALIAMNAKADAPKELQPSLINLVQKVYAYHRNRGDSDKVSEAYAGDSVESFAKERETLKQLKQGLKQTCDQFGLDYASSISEGFIKLGDDAQTAFIMADANKQVVVAMCNYYKW